MDPTHVQIIKRHGVSAISERLGERPGTVRMWQNRGRIPAEQWASFAAHGLASLEELALAAAKQDRMIQQAHA